jgi:hypothetical protein
MEKSPIGCETLSIRVKFHSPSDLDLMLALVPFLVVLRFKILRPAFVWPYVVLLAVFHAGRFIP